MTLIFKVGDTTTTNEGETPEQTPAEEPAVEQVKQEPGLTAEEIAKLNSELAIGTEQKEEEPTVESDQSNYSRLFLFLMLKTQQNQLRKIYTKLSIYRCPWHLSQLLSVAENEIKAINQANAQLTKHIQMY